MSKDDDGPKDYKVGYRRPPSATRFKPGQSGNPKGRPKGKRNIKTELEEVLGQKVRITEGGKTRALTKGRALMMRAVAKGLIGDMKAIALVFTLATRSGALGAAPEAIEQPSDADDIATLQAYIQRLAMRPADAPADDEGEN